MSKLLFDPDGGELRLSKIGNSRVEHIPLLIAVISDIFSNLIQEDIKPKNKEFVYCIQFSPDDQQVVEGMIEIIEVSGLPKGVYFYRCDGKVLFEIRGPSGGVVTSMAFYIITLAEIGTIYD